MNQMPKDALWQARVLEGDTLGAVLYPKPDEQRKGFPSEEWYDVITKLCQELGEDAKFAIVQVSGTPYVPSLPE